MAIFSKLLGFKMSSSEHLLSLDIGTEVVKALIFKVDENNGTGVVKGVGRVRQGLKDMHSGAVSDISGWGSSGYTFYLYDSWYKGY